MNIDKVKKLRDTLASLKPQQKFDHAQWAYVDDASVDENKPDANHCGTSACICGWLAISEGDATLAKDRWGRWEWVLPDNADWLRYGQGVLDLTFEEAHALFVPEYHEDDVESAVYMWDYITEDEYWELYEDDMLNLNTTTVEHAIAFLDRMIENRSVDLTWWGEIKEDV